MARHPLVAADTSRERIGMGMALMISRKEERRDNVVRLNNECGREDVEHEVSRRKALLVDDSHDRARQEHRQGNLADPKGEFDDVCSRPGAPRQP